MLLSLHFLPAPTGGTCGGFLCDEMGLGKTLECLMLVLSNPAPPGWATSTAEARAEFLGIGNKITPSEPELGASEGLVEPLPIRTTLVVVPSNLLNQWKEQINAHLQQSILKW